LPAPKKPVISRITGFFPYSEISFRASDAPKRPYSSFSQKSAKAAGENVDVHKTASVPAVMSAGIVLAVH